MKTPHLFFEETNGKIIDVDGVYGGQCWDLWALFCQEYIGIYYSCIWTGGVKDMYYHFDELDLGEYFEKIPFEKYHELQDGDWLVWDADTNPLCWISTARNEKGEAYGHIAMFRQYNPTNVEQNVILTQNPNGNPNYTHQMVCDFLGFIGALRPKCYINEEIVNTPVDLPKEKVDEDEELAIELINSDKENPLVEFIKWIIKIIQKLMKGEHHD